MRVWRIALLATTAICSPTLAAADPVTATLIVGTVVAAAAGSAAAAAAGAIVGALVSAAISIGFGILAQALSGSTDQQVKGRSRDFDPHPPFRFAFGEFPQDGTVIFHHSEGPNYFVVYLLSSIPIHSVDRVVILGTMDLDVTNQIGADLYDMDATTNWSEANVIWNEGDCQIWIGRGDHTKPPQQWIDLGVLVPSDIWKGVGVAFVQFQIGNASGGARQIRLSQGIPPPLRFTGRWSKLYDPRRDSTSGVPGASGNHRIDDRTTWEYIASDDGTEIGANPALQWLMLATHEYALGLDHERILIEQVAEAADACEESGGVFDGEFYAFEPGSGDVPAFTSSTGTHSLALIEGSADYATTQYSPTLSGTVLRIKGTHPNLSTVAVYFDMTEEGIPAGGVEVAWSGLSAGSNNDTYVRIRIYEADAGAGTADNSAFGLPPDAENISVVLDTGLDQFPNLTTFSSFTVSKRYFSVVMTGGSDSGTEHWERQTLTLTATSSAARYRSDGLVTIEDRDFSIFDGVLAAMAGHVDPTDGLLGIRAGVWEAPADTLTQPIGDEISIDGARDNEADVVVAKFLARDREYQEDDGPGYTLRPGNRRFPLELAMVRERHQAARLEKITALRSVPNRIVEDARWSGREAGRRVGERVTFALDGLGRVSSSYVVDSKRLIWQAAPLPDGTTGVRVETEMRLVEDLEATYAFTLADYTPVPPADLPDTGDPTVDAPTISAEQSDYRTVDDENHARLAVTVSHTDELGQFRVEYSTDGGTTWTLLTTQLSAASSETVYLDPAVVGVTYIARARREDDLVGFSDWVVSNPVTIVAPAVDFLLLESSDFLLLEDGFRLELES